MGKDYGWGVFVGIGIGLIISLLISLLISIKYPIAMDVYQGKTTLEYKVVDGEIVDSCVVWKK